MNAFLGYRSHLNECNSNNKHLSKTKFLMRFLESLFINKQGNYVHITYY